MAACRRRRRFKKRKSLIIIKCNFSFRTRKSPILKLSFEVQTLLPFSSKKRLLAQWGFHCYYWGLLFLLLSPLEINYRLLKKIFVLRKNIALAKGKQVKCDNFRKPRNGAEIHSALPLAFHIDCQKYLTYVTKLFVSNSMEIFLLCSVMEK